MTSHVDPFSTPGADGATPAGAPAIGRRTFIASIVGAAVLAGCSRSSGDDQASSDTTTDITTSGSTPAPSGTETPATTSSAAGGELGLFDTSRVHQVEVSFDQADYDAMISTLADTGDKEWIEVTAVIDGVTYERAGARLKGNSSLAGLSGAGPGGGLGGRPGVPPGANEGADVPVPPADGGFGGGPGPIGSASADEPEGLPWLIRLDKFVEDQEHLGYNDIVIRSNNTATSLNEAVALDLLDAVGLASQAAASTRFTVNGGTTALRLMIEHPDDGEWQRRNFDGDGALYKAESTGDWSYRGDDPTSYDQVFDQEGGKDVADLTPLIEFLAFVDESDDTTFAAELPERLDVDSFAIYLAMMDLLDNFDDIDGPGNNAYIWWDAESGRFTIVPWDLNLAFGGIGGFGGVNPGGGGFQPPDGFEPPDGFVPPDGFEPPAGFDPNADPGPGGFGGFGGSNPLVERFRAVDDFEALYQQHLADLDEEFFSSGIADELLEARAAVLVEQASELVDSEIVTQEADAIAASIAG